MQDVSVEPDCDQAQQCEQATTRHQAIRNNHRLLCIKDRSRCICSGRSCPTGGRKDLARTVIGGSPRGWRRPLPREVYLIKLYRQSKGKSNLNLAPRQLSSVLPLAPEPPLPSCFGQTSGLPDEHVRLCIQSRTQDCHARCRSRGSAESGRIAPPHRWLRCAAIGVSLNRVVSS